MSSKRFTGKEFLALGEEKQRQNVKRLLWGARTRCHNKKRKSFSRYGGRGITFDEGLYKQVDEILQLKIEACKKYPNEYIYMDRIDNDGHYLLENLRFVTPTESNNNIDKENNRKSLSLCKKGKGLGKENNFYGKSHTQETKDRISKANKGKPSPTKGVKMPDSVKKKLSDSWTEDKKEKMSKLNVANRNKKSFKGVWCNRDACYFSLKCAGNLTGVKWQTIYWRCKNPNFPDWYFIPKDKLKS